jgi:WD40 repeat protein
MNCRLVLAALLLSSSAVLSADQPGEVPVSFHRQIRPILLRKCQGCHQPARKKGGLVLTGYDEFVRGGKSGEPWVAGKPEASRLLKHLRGTDDHSIMPQDEPLPAEQIDLFSRWVRQGAHDDTPAEFKRTLVGREPPTYTQPVTVTALAYSPDGNTLAVAGYREVLLHRADGFGTPANLPLAAVALSGQHGSIFTILPLLTLADGYQPSRGLVGRLVGLSERIESILFSPNSETLLVAGGSAGRFGELQFWDWKKRELQRSLLPSHDTIYGASFAPDGQRVAFGCADNSARVIDVATGKQLLRIDHHLDWVFGTALSSNGKALVTASRDRSVKMSEADTGALLGNITTLDPNQLGGGLRGLLRRPGTDQYLVAGEDGMPQLFNGTVNYNANLLRNYTTKLKGRIEALAFSADGVMLAAGGVGGIVRVYGTDNAAVVANLDVPTSVFALAFRPGGKQIAVAGLDGKVRVFSLPDGKLVRDYIPVPLEATRP